MSSLITMGSHFIVNNILEVCTFVGSIGSPTNVVCRV
jgi:hypothetical protein